MRNRKARALMVLIMLSVLVAIGWMYRLDKVDRNAGNFGFVPTDTPGVRRLAVGRHQLVVQRPRAQENADPRACRIPFWR